MLSFLTLVMSVHLNVDIWALKVDSSPTDNRKGGSLKVL